MIRAIAVTTKSIDKKNPNDPIRIGLLGAVPFPWK